MNERAFLSLVGIEVRRGRRQMLRVLVIIAVVVAALVATGLRTPQNVALLLAAGGLGFIGVVPGGVVRDKLGGTMEFLATLPASASVLVGARFAAAILFAAVGGIMVAVASGLALPPLLGTVGPGRVVVVAFLVGWMAISAVACFAAGLLTRFNVNTLLTRVPVILIALVLGGIYAIEAVFGDPIQGLRAIMAHDQGVYIAGAIMVLGAGGLVAGSFFLARRGMENFRPQLDSIDW